MFTTNPETIQAGGLALRIISSGFIVSSISVTASGALEGLGKGVQSLLISLMRYVVIIMPAAFILSRIRGAVGVWNAFWITELISAIASVWIYRKSLNTKLGTPLIVDGDVTLLQSATSHLTILY